MDVTNREAVLESESEPEEDARVFAGPRCRELWPERTTLVGESEMITLRELSRELERRGIIKRSTRRLREYYTSGTIHPRTKQKIHMRAVMLGTTYYGCIRWFKDFWQAHEGMTEDL